MRLTLPVSISLLLLTFRATSAQTAGEFFNSGAQLYISDDKPGALKKVEDGLKIYADDAKLKKLEALLKKQQQSQSSQSQQNPQKQQQDKQQPQKQQPNDQKNQQQQQQNQQAPEKASQDQQSQEKQKQDQAKQDKKEQEKQEEQAGSSAQVKDSEKADQNAKGQPGQMTPEEAKRLLDAQKGDEQMLQMKPMGKPPDSPRPVKDW